MHARTSLPRAAGALLAAVALATAITACGGDDGPKTPTSVPAGDVAVVADQGIAKARFDRALASRVAGVSPLGGTATATPLDTPDFTRCVAAQRTALKAASKDAVVPSKKQLRANCQAQYQQARSATMTALLQENWILQEAADNDIEITDAAVAATLKQYVAAAGLKNGASLPAAEAQRRFTRLLKRSGLTLDDLRAQLRAQLAQSKLQQKSTETVTTPTPAEAKRYLAANAQLFGTPGTATIDVIVAKTPADAKTAKVALEKGTAVQSIIQDLAAKGQTGARQGRIPLTQGDGQLPKNLEGQVFAAKRNTVVGPVKVGALYYVVLVREATKGKVPPYRKVAPQVNQQLASQQAQQAQLAAQAALLERWRPQTLCAKGYIVPECSNGTKTGASVNPK